MVEVFKIMFTVEVVKFEAIIAAKKWVIGNNWNFWNFIYPCSSFVEQDFASVSVTSSKISLGGSKI